MHSRLILATGVPGAGVSTVLKTIEKRGKVKFNYLNFGDIMLKVGKQREYVESRDEIRRLPVRKQKELQLLTAVEIQEKGEQLYVVDTHCTIKTPEGYFPGFPRTILEQLDPVAIVLVEADADEIAKRRSADTTRKRDAEDAEAIREHQAMNRSAAMSYAAFIGSPVLIIQNRNNKLDEAAAAVEKIFEAAGLGKWG